MTEIVGYRAEYRDDFEALNLSWLEEHGLLEPADLIFLQEPEQHILEVGGEVYFAVEDGKVLGTCAAIPLTPDRMELAKLVVSPAARGRGIARQLVRAVLGFARESGARSVELTSNSRLQAAVGLYEAMGFQHAPLPADVRYQTANVYMTLDLA